MVADFFIASNPLYILDWIACKSVVCKEAASCITAAAPILSGFTANTPAVPSMAAVFLPSNDLLNAAPRTFGSAPKPGTNGEAKLKLSTRCAGKPELFTKSSSVEPLNLDSIICFAFNWFLTSPSTRVYRSCNRLI